MKTNNLNNFFLIGPMGSGKSTLGRLLARELKLNFYDLDEVIVERSGMSINQIFNQKGEVEFRIQEREITDEYTQKSHVVLATGGGVILDPRNRSVLTQRGIVIYLMTSIEQQLKRVKHDTNRPLLQADDLEKKLRQLAELRESYYLEIADYIFETNSHSPDTLIETIIKNLGVL